MKSSRRQVLIVLVASLATAGSLTAARRFELGSDRAEEVAQEVFAALTRELERRGITIEDVLLRDIQLPATLKASIEAKQQAELAEGLT